MSILSAQCDELRSMADSVGLAMPQAATLMMEAADTIWELRDDLQRANAENARLREEIEAAKHDLSLFSGELVASKLENAKLRELVKALLTCATDGDCDECRLNGATPWHVGKAQLCDGVWDCVRELGVEVDG